MFDCFLLTSVFRISIVAQEDIDDLQTDSDHDEDNTVDIQIKVHNNDWLVMIYLLNGITCDSGNICNPKF